MKRYLLIAVLVAGCGSAAADSPKGLPNEPGGYVCVGGTPIHTVPAWNTWECDGEWQPSTDMTTTPTSDNVMRDGYMCVNGTPLAVTDPTPDPWICDGTLVPFTPNETGP